MSFKNAACWGPAAVSRADTGTGDVGSLQGHGHPGVYPRYYPRGMPLRAGLSRPSRSAMPEGAGGEDAGRTQSLEPRQTPPGGDAHSLGRGALPVHLLSAFRMIPDSGLDTQQRKTDSVGREGGADTVLGRRNRRGHPAGGGTLEVRAGGRQLLGPLRAQAGVRRVPPRFPRNGTPERGGVPGPHTPEFTDVLSG